MNMNIEEVKQFCESELGFPVYIAPANNIFTVILETDFQGILPNSNVASLDDLRSYILDLQSHTGIGEAEVIASRLVDGIWSAVRAIAYSAKTRADKATALKVANEAKLRRTYDDILAKNPAIAGETETLLNLQLKYGVIDHPTYALLIKNHFALQTAIKAAQDAAKAAVIAEQAS